MNTGQAVTPIRRSAGRYARVHLLLGIQTAALVLLFFNRISEIPDRFIFGFAYFRWSDLLNLVVIPLISLGGFALLKREIDRAGNNRLLNLAFFAGIFLLGSSYAVLEVSDYLTETLCLVPGAISERLCNAATDASAGIYNWIFFSGFMLVNAALMFIQSRSSLPGRLSRLDKTLLVVNGLFVGTGLFAILAFLQSGVEVILLALLALFALEMLRKRNTQPLAVYYATVFWLGLIGAGLSRMF